VKYLLLLPLLTGCLVMFPNPGDGEKVGTIIKLSHEGVLCKTGEGQLIRGGMANGSGAFGVTPFDFTVPDSLWPQAEQAFTSQREVRIRYHAAWGWACSSETGHYLTGIAPAQ
jgi:hypothetical protein